ncbi:GNAT family N-acetyltransferase [Devosia sp. SL43]|uniref:GNAT family N-acetyltransferase n=1 Tax=Devosia sp. SL43 TaxID=2806348 RepID=UPI001F408490|nr:GNAT family protein [Devosia sp. SL43]UJW86193.1 GNAT family N-acetyltransferase [Devosia sp. SL43]
MVQAKGAPSARSLQTDRPNLQLRLLTTADAPLLHRLVAENATHLTRHGDYMDLVALSRADLKTELSGDGGDHLRFGILLKGQLIGRVDLIAVDPPRYGIGYWLAENATGHGYASAALRALIVFAQGDAGMSDFYAGVTHGNLRSSALLERVGFVSVARFETYTRYHLALGLV